MVCMYMRECVCACVRVCACHAVTIPHCVAFKCVQAPSLLLLRLCVPSDTSDTREFLEDS